MAIYALNFGLNQILQNQAYSLPNRICTVFTDATTPTIQQSSDAAFTANSAITLTAGQANVAGGFIRCTTGNINLTIKRA